MTPAETQIALNPARLAEITKLDRGGHAGPDKGMCVMEAVSYVAGEQWSDRPDCVCQIVGAFMRAWNDALPDELRTEIMLPLIPKITGSVVSRDAQVRRAYALADSAARIFAPAALRAAGINGWPEQLEALPEITDATSAAHAREALLAAAYAAADAAAYAAAYAAADAAARAAARAAYAAAYAAADAAADAARVEFWRGINPKIVALVERVLAMTDAPAA